MRAAVAAGMGAGAIGAEGGAMAGQTTTAGPSTALRSAQDDNGRGGQEFYQLRKYALRNGPQTVLTQGYFERALIPALGRLGMGPVGAFKLDIGPETPTYYVLIPATDAAALVELDAKLGADAEYVKAAAGFRDAPATAPAFERAERTLLGAFTGWPKLVAPKLVDGKLPKRIFQLRTYESPSQAAHARKVAMFNEAEIGIFVRTGLTPVFFAETLVGTRMPSLTYMLTFADTAELTAKWAAFGADAAWKELSRKPGNTDAEIVSNISNLYLSPLACSQI
ncbi:MAG TPA: NIPSNAP family protein [Acidobacteriaceae bacterium]|nr:NIPSNAP family protein [Acidobacteriaceae bacterium]